VLVSQKEPPRSLLLPRTWEELERMTNLLRNEPLAPTRDDIARMERKALPSWGRKRKKFQGP